MTYIYCTVWKIGQIEPKRYRDAIVFARLYSGREKDLKIEDAGSIFAYSIMPEKDIAKLFKIVELDKSQIDVVSDLVDTRNDMAHESGKFAILKFCKGEHDGYDNSEDFINEQMVQSFKLSINELLVCNEMRVSG